MASEGPLFRTLNSFMSIEFKHIACLVRRRLIADRFVPARSHLTRGYSARENGYRPTSDPNVFNRGSGNEIEGPLPEGGFYSKPARRSRGPPCKRIGSRIDSGRTDPRTSRPVPSDNLITSFLGNREAMEPRSRLAFQFPK